MIIELGEHLYIDHYGKRLCELRAARDVVYRVAPQDKYL